MTAAFAFSVLIGAWLLLRSYRRFTLTMTHDGVVRDRLRRERRGRQREAARRLFARFARLARGILRFLVSPLRDWVKDWRGSSMRREIAYIAAALVLFWLGWINRTELVIVVAWVLAKGIFDRMRDQQRAIAELRAQIDSAKR